MFNDMMRAEIWLQDRLETQQGIEDLAQRLGYSASQVRRNFKRCFGVSPSTYRDRLRVEQAAILLSYTQLNIHSVAYRCGYRNHSAFSRAFLRYFGTSPREFRKDERHRLEKLRNGPTREYPFRIGHDTPQQAVVTRLYHHRVGKRNSIEDLAKHVTLEALPKKLRKGRTIAIIHGNDLNSDFARADLGIQVDADIADELATPLPFRTLSLPACRYASVMSDDLDELRPIIDFLLAKALPERGERISGLPPRLIWQKSREGKTRHPSRFEFRLPLCDPG
ncbi:hypothetical protein GCM10007160_41080 [Litchfieldella qijiaojingensis]|uniref:HTH araC/xylS-type domain-containing protein n=1 Tax=Litchfieldella qijiaojingensis TaxID=980347 RepID=A0ABQ2Z9P2_9GAMM|nr:AraC family transcriptional regulator [Halomonas qijiaojingensis]GGY09561.1 hypothetical protein GCM10007160_41080 [Halomonas qijiaojingensis]